MQPKFSKSKELFSPRLHFSRVSYIFLKSLRFNIKRTMSLQQREKRNDKKTRHCSGPADLSTLFFCKELLYEKRTFFKAKSNSTIPNTFRTCYTWKEKIIWWGTLRLSTSLPFRDRNLIRNKRRSKNGFATAIVEKSDQRFHRVALRASATGRLKRLMSEFFHSFFRTKAKPGRE